MGLRVGVSVSVSCDCFEWPSLLGWLSVLYGTDSVGDKNGVMNCVGVGVRTGAYAFASSAFFMLHSNSRRETALGCVRA